VLLRGADGGASLRQAHGAEIVFLALILVAAGALRLYGLNWDAGHWLHPDERQIYFVVMDLEWPRSLAEVLSPDSPLNPGFFAYGSLPIYLLKLAVTLLEPLWPAVRSSGELHLVGRLLAVLFDLGSISLTYRLARTLGGPVTGERDEEGAQFAPGGSEIAGRTSKLAPGAVRALFAAGLLSVAVLAVQIAHFYTADPLLTFTVVLTLNLASDVARGGGLRRQVALGVGLGLAMATKVSAAPLVLVVLVAFGAEGARKRALGIVHKAPWLVTVRGVIMTLAVAGLAFLVAQPYALIDWPTYVNDTIRESQIARGTYDVPYTVQYAGTWPFLYSMWQTALWGLGLPLGLVGWISLIACLVRWLRSGGWTDALLLAWAGPYFVITALLQARHLRYMLPLVPILCILVARSLPQDCRERPRLTRCRVVILGYWGMAGVSLAYALILVSMYAKPHSWIVASEWIYTRAVGGSSLTVEHWDTALPLPLDVEGQPRRPTEYDVRTLAPYDEPESATTWESASADLASSDYLVIASRRLYGSIPRIPDRYPVGSRYYDLLFAGELGFEQVGEFTRGPQWLNPPIPPLPGAAPALLRPDESFVVYDHPRALVFRNSERLSAEELQRRLMLETEVAPGN
jgi:hypothetical protein